jgi:hypothetical protein
MHGEDQRVGILCRLGRRTSSRARTRIARKFFELPLGPRIAEHDLVARSGKDRPELATHPARAKNADAHVAS